MFKSLIKKTTFGTSPTHLLYKQTAQCFAIKITMHSGPIEKFFDNFVWNSQFF